MAESAYTRGPWTADRDDDVLAPDGTGIASVHGDDADNQTANARLIAAAPDLVEAVEFAAMQLRAIADPNLADKLALDKCAAALRRALGQEER